MSTDDEPEEKNKELTNSAQMIGMNDTEEEMRKKSIQRKRRS